MPGEKTVTIQRKQETENGEKDSVFSGQSPVISAQNSPITNQGSQLFDSMAKSYDQEFTNSVLGKLLRKRVWKKISKHFKSGDHILEINCGTGEDAIWMAKQGMFVTATDASEEMIKIAKEKLGREEIEIKRRVSFQQKSFSEIESAKVLYDFDGVLSDFGGINVINKWNELADSLSKITKPNSKIILVPMGKFCFWEMIWFSLHADFKKAFRRFNQPAKFGFNGKVIEIFYPALKELKESFSQSFSVESVQGLGIILPPSYFKKWVEKFSGIFHIIDIFDRLVCRLFFFFGDHLIVVMRRK